MELNGRRLRTRDWVVGDHVSSSKWPLGRQSFDAMFGSDDGLHHGLNKLTLTAWRGDGNYDRASLRVLVPRATPLITAGRGARTKVGSRVRLRGRASAPGGRELGLRWRVARAPRGSHARLRNPRSARASLVPDVPGRYRLRLVARAPAGFQPRQQPSGQRRSPAFTGAAPRASEALDEVTVEASPNAPPIGVPITTISGSGGIEVNGKTYEPNPGAWAQMLVLDRSTLEVESNRSFGNASNVFGGLEDLTVALDKLDAGDIVVISGGDRSVDIGSRFWNLDGVMLEVAGVNIDGILTWPNDWHENTAAGRWSVIGVPGVDGSAHHNLFGALHGGPGSRQGDLSGYLQQNQNGYYDFVSTEYTTIDTNAPGAPAGANTIHVGSQRYTSRALPSGHAGFHLLVLDSTLALVDEATFDTTTYPSVFPSLARRIGQYLSSGLGGNAYPGYLVVLQSIGRPSILDSTHQLWWVNDTPFLEDSFGYNANAAVPRDPVTWGRLSLSPGSVTPVAGALGELGGPAAHDQFAALNHADAAGRAVSKEGYTLIASTGQLGFGSGTSEPVDPASVPVSRVYAPSSGQSNRGTPLSARVVGTLSLDRQSLWKVSTPGLVGVSEEGSLGQVAYQKPTAWPLSSTAGETAANAYITRQLGYDSDNLRIEYYEDSGQNWNAIDSKLQAIDYPGGGHGFSAATFAAVKGQLGIEVLDVAQVWTLIGEWQSVFTTAEVNGLLDLQTIAARIEHEISKLDSRSNATARTLGVIGDSLFIADELLAVTGADPLAAGVGVTAGAFDVASDVAITSSGVPSLAPVEAEAGQLGPQLAQRYEDIQSNISTLGAILVSDWGKLQQAAKNTEGAWKWDRSTTPQNVKHALTIGAEREFWAAMLSTVYGVYAVDPRFITGHRDTTDPWEIDCQTPATTYMGNPHHTHPFGKTDKPHNPSSWVQRPVASGFISMWFGLTTQASFESPYFQDPQVTHSPDVMPQSITGPLFAPLGSSSGALGIDPFAFQADPRFDRWWFYCAT